MSRSPSLCGVILAAGASTRMGTDKALLPWPPLAPGEPAVGQTFLSAAIRSLSLETDAVIVVAGENAPNLAPVVYANGAYLVRNPAPERGQFSSLQIGLQEVLNRGRDSAMITLVDRPPARLATIEKLRTAFSAAPIEVWAVVPEYAGKHGHPYVAARELIEIFLKAPPTAKAREIEHQHQQHLQYLVVDDPFVTMNVDTPQDCAALQSQPVLR
ncbi:MAG TPA: nucleotidyltransferase family protein [Terriglobales bacterium]|nr:nucleotidyltransferase family protein [Terriglobales bacterium]